MKRKILAATLVVTATLLANEAAAQAKPEVLVKQRKAAMTLQSKYLGPMVGMAQGIRMAARTRPLPLNSAFSTRATMRPRTVSKKTDTTEKRTVFQTAFHQAGSTSVPRQTTLPEERVRIDK